MRKVSAGGAFLPLLRLRTIAELEAIQAGIERILKHAGRYGAPIALALRTHCVRESPLAMNRNTSCESMEFHEF